MPTIRGSFTKLSVMHSAMTPFPSSAPGCCGDINHVAPRGKERNSTTVIGTSLGQTISNGLRELQPIENPVLEVRSAVVRLPLRSAGAAEVTQSLATLAKVQAGESVDFYDHVAAWAHHDDRSAA